MRNLCEIFQILQIQKRILFAEFICGNTVITILSQRSSVEFASWSQKAGSSPQNLWPILYAWHWCLPGGYSAQAIATKTEGLWGCPKKTRLKIKKKIKKKLKKIKLPTKQNF